MLPRSAPVRASSFLALAPGDEAAPQPHLAFRESYRASLSRRARGKGSVRVIALGVLGVAVGAGATVLGVAYSQASDNIDMYATIRQQRPVARAPVYVPVSAPVYVSRTAPTAYAPSRSAAPNLLGSVNGNGTVIPLFNLNPFNTTGGDGQAARRGQSRKAAARATSEAIGVDVVSGAANVPRTICVRLCDGFQHPLGYLRDSADLRGHAALCTAMFPGVPTAVYRVAAGADGIDDAVGPDGKTYRQLPMAYAYQTSIDPVCAKPRTGQQTVSLLKDFTLRPGDTVVLNGRARTFNGASSYPYTAANFSDFRRSGTIGEATRRQIDERVGISRQERLQRQVREQARVREANAAGGSAVDVIRGGPSLEPSPVRVIDLYRR
jgi:hypothetical protein